VTDSRLLDGALDAHGGLDRWGKAREVRARVRSGGFAPRSKLVAGSIASYAITVTAHEPRAVFEPYPRSARRGVFEADRVRIEDARGAVLDERWDARAAFSGLSSLRRNLWWDHLDMLHFAGYAMWNYLTTPFLLAGSGFELREGEPWEEGDERWRRLHVSFPPGVPTHNREQAFYFDEHGLLRRHDYTAEVFGGWANAAHYCYEHRESDGIVFPTRRRVYPRRRDGRPRVRPTIVWIDLDDVAVA
jgi:hypothetical protein